MKPRAPVVRAVYKCREAHRQWVALVRRKMKRVKKDREAFEFWDALLKNRV